MTIARAEPKSPSPARAVPLQPFRNANKRWPPMANRNALPYKLTVISKEKLAREATAPDPNLRRCVAHFRLHCGSVEWTENDMKSRISSFEFEETDDEDELDTTDDQEDLMMKNTVIRVVEPPAEITPPTKTNTDSGMLVQSQDCMDSNKNFCCVTVSPCAG